MNRHFEDRRKGKVIPKSKENLTIMKTLEMYNRVPEQWELLNEIEKLNKRIDKAIKLLKEYISSTKGIINDYSYHEELHKQDIINMKGDISFYENVIKTLEGEGDKNE